MTCNICGAEPCINPSFCRTCRKADARHRRDPNAERQRRLLADDISLQRAYAEISSSHIKGRAANSTVEALLYGLRSGVSALKEPDVRRRLSQLSDDQLVEVGAKLRRRGPEIGGAWTANEIETLMHFARPCDENR
jgi:hypothetical protein